MEIWLLSYHAQGTGHKALIVGANKSEIAYAATLELKVQLSVLKFLRKLEHITVQALGDQPRVLLVI